MLHQLEDGVGPVRRHLYNCCDIDGTIGSDTGIRRNDGAMLTWSRVNLEEGWLYLPNPKISIKILVLLCSRRAAQQDI